MAEAKKSHVPKGYEESKLKDGWSKRGGEILKWEEGLQVTGNFISLTPAKSEDSSPIVAIRTEDGIVRYWCPTILESSLEGVEKGDEVDIICLGRIVKVKRGEPAWGFEVYVK